MKLFPRAAFSVLSAFLVCAQIGPAEAQQRYGDWIFSQDAKNGGSCSITTFTQTGEDVMFGMIGIPELTVLGSAPDVPGPTINVVLYRQPGYPQSSGFQMKLTVDSAADFFVRGEVLGGGVSAFTQYDGDFAVNFFEHASAGRFLMVDPGNGFFPVGFSLRGSSKAIERFRSCVERLR